MDVKAVLFDVFGTVVDWRGSLIGELSQWGATRRLTVDWPGLVDAWRGAYAPSMDRVRRDEVPWTILDDLHRASLDRLVAQFGITGLSEADLDWINRGWHRLRPWPDAVAGLARLKKRCIIGTLSNGNVALLVEMAKSSGLPWDVITPIDLIRHYKPDRELYLGACQLLRLRPDQVMLAAAHNGDLGAARALGLKTCFFPRPAEYGPHQTHDFHAEQAWDVVAADMLDFAARMGT
jgi:2-haloacid dehalogenase